ncbi:hypothetical protein [Nitrospira sp. M1]
MSIQPTSATTQYSSQQPKSVHAPQKDGTSVGSGSHQHSRTALPAALLDPFLTVGEATLEGLIQRHHPPNRSD